MWLQFQFQLKKAMSVQNMCSFITPTFKDLSSLLSLGSDMISPGILNILERVVFAGKQSFGVTLQVCTRNKGVIR